jgi:hypothetical protein
LEKQTLDEKKWDILCKRATDAQDPLTLYEFTLEVEALFVEEQSQPSLAA